MNTFVQRLNIQNLRASILLALLTVYLVWGSTYLAIRVALTSIPPFLMIGSRFLLAGAFLYAFLRLRNLSSPNRKQWLNAALVGALMLGGGVGGTAFAEQWVASGLAAIGIATVPIWVAIFGGLLWKKWPSRVEWIGLGIGFLGVGLLNLEGNLQSNPAGATALLVAATSWAFGSVLSRNLTLPSGPMGYAAEMLTGGSLLLIAGVIRGEQVSVPITFQAVAAWLYLIVFGSLLAFSAYMYLFSQVRPTIATSYAYVNPIIAVILGVGIVEEQVTVIGIAAMVTILAGVGLMAIAHKGT